MNDYVYLIENAIHGMKRGYDPLEVMCWYNNAQMLEGKEITPEDISQIAQHVVFLYNGKFPDFPDDED